MNEWTKGSDVIVANSAKSGAAALDPEGSLAERVTSHVGARIRERRVMLGMSAAQLAARIGVTQQQEHKYERGLNQMSAGRLYEVACALDVTPGYFYEELDAGGEVSSSCQRRSLLDLVRHFKEMADPRHRDALVKLAHALNEEEAAE